MAGCATGGVLGLRGKILTTLVLLRPNVLVIYNVLTIALDI